MPKDIFNTPMEKRVASFWSRVNKSGLVHPVLQSACWEWTGAMFVYGYGQIKMDGHLIKAHRFSYYLHYGQWPEPYCCHHCDNRRCVNPTHLFAGTALDNNHDKIKKGRAKGPPIKTHCDKGHPIEGANLMTWIESERNLRKRKCRVCHNAYQRRRYAERNGVANA